MPKQAAHVRRLRELLFTGSSMNDRAVLSFLLRLASEGDPLGGGLRNMLKALFA